MRPAPRADNSAVPVVPTVRVRTAAQLFIPPLSLHDVLLERFPFNNIMSASRAKVRFSVFQELANPCIVLLRRHSSVHDVPVDNAT